jgi:hypothetical protein
MSRALAAAAALFGVLRRKELPFTAILDASVPLLCQPALAVHGIGEHDVHESFRYHGFIVAYFGDNSEKAATLPVSIDGYSQPYFRNPLCDAVIMR